MGKLRKWEIKIDEEIHIITYEFSTIKGKQIIKVDNKELPFEKQYYKPFIGMDRLIMLGNKECRFVLVGNKADIAIDGTYIDSKKPYMGLKSIPWWLWIFVVACIAIPIVALGGALPVVIAILGAIYCVRASVSPFMNTPLKLLSCLGITTIAWGLYGLLLFAMSNL